jgi:hypothetical protein
MRRALRQLPHGASGIRGRPPAEAGLDRRGPKLAGGRVRGYGRSIAAVTRPDASKSRSTACPTRAGEP